MQFYNIIGVDSLAVSKILFDIDRFIEAVSFVYSATLLEVMIFMHAIEWMQAGPINFKFEFRWHTSFITEKIVLVKIKVMDLGVQSIS